MTTTDDDITLRVMAGTNNAIHEAMNRRLEELRAIDTRAALEGITVRRRAPRSRVTRRRRRTL